MASDFIGSKTAGVAAENGCPPDSGTFQNTVMFWFVQWDVSNYWALQCFLMQHYVRFRTKPNVLYTCFIYFY